MRTCISITGVLLMIAATTDAGLQGASVPKAAFSAAAADPETFIGILAKMRVPAGLEIRDRDRPRTNAVRVEARDSSVVSLAEVLDAFNRQHSDYRAAMVDGVVVVRPLTGRVEYLDSAAAGLQVRTRGVMNAARALFAPLNPMLNAAGGQPGSVPGLPNAAASVDYGDDIAIAVALHGQTVGDVLNEIARLAPGQAWLTVTHGDEAHPVVMQVGFIQGPGVATQLPIQTRRP